MWRVEGEKCWRQQRHLGDFAPMAKSLNEILIRQLQADTGSKLPQAETY